MYVHAQPHSLRGLVLRAAWSMMDRSKQHVGPLDGTFKDSD